MNKKYLPRGIIAVLVWLLTLALQLLLPASAEAKIINSDFFNQSSSGSEGPQLLELELHGQKAFILSYYAHGEKTRMRTITEKEYKKLKIEMNGLLKAANEDPAKDQFCENSFVLTNVKLEKTVSNTPLCWERLTNQKRAEITNWIVAVRKSLR